MNINMYNKVGTLMRYSYLSSCLMSPIAQTATETSMSSASSIIRLENLSVNRPRVVT
uniref:Sister-chromatid cohesion protein 3 isoform X1 n=1 Tax=Rhizophora mucronata TaxID=61149 RepID=A0A2P2M869_RHIMU